jgi:hypothetical protein
MRVHDRNGRSEDVEIRHATGSIENPMSTTQLEAKARGLLGDRFGDLQALLAGYGLTS